MNRAFRLSTLAFAAAVAMPAPAAAITSTFDTDDEGWRVVDLDTNSLGDAAYLTGGVPVAYQHLATGGNPGGYLEATDPSDRSFFFQAPAAFLGDLSAYAGGNLSWDTQYTPKDGNDWRGDPDVILSDGTLALVWRAAQNPGSTWTPMSVVLGPGAGWTVGGLGGAAATLADFDAVLGSVSVLRLRGEYYTGVLETTGIDNVTLAAAVPEPATWAMVAGGLGVLGLWARRRRR